MQVFFCKPTWKGRVITSSAFYLWCARVKPLNAHIISIDCNNFSFQICVDLNEKLPSLSSLDCLDVIPVCCTNSLVTKYTPYHFWYHCRNILYTKEPRLQFDICTMNNKKCFHIIFNSSIYWLWCHRILEKYFYVLCFLMKRNFNKKMLYCDNENSLFYQLNSKWK